MSERVLKLYSKVRPGAYDEVYLCDVPDKAPHGNIPWGAFQHRKPKRIGANTMQYLIMCRSLTYAQRSASLLERGGITASVVKAPQGLSNSGCGYAVSIYRHFEEALRQLKQNNMISGKIFRRVDNGEYREIS